MPLCYKVAMCVHCHHVCALSQVGTCTDMTLDVPMIKKNWVIGASPYLHLWHWNTFSPQFPHTPGLAGTDAEHRGHCSVSVDAWYEKDIW